MWKIKIAKHDNVLSRLMLLSMTSPSKTNCVSTTQDGGQLEEVAGRNSLFCKYVYRTG